MNPYLLLVVSIISEVFASSMLKATEGFKRLLPSVGVALGYGIAFYALSLTLKTMPIGTAYAIWAGVGTALTAVAGAVLYKESFNSKKVIGLLLVIGGVILLNFGGAH
ncbi:MULTISPECIES: multidrug efflux SMR transporter [Bacillaceae]|uniref:DMT family transporter n=1 Tax=Bacillaceae TaxID=186817 RepID=UPI001E61A938|nr:MULTISPECIES: multidrug efflux SMR transporter [Bacillaceae]MCE4048172.1 multidrug efflux SMR transporter [Bacillus sp. Au-Bac7]MCM3033388.1 multidrug efflux SMR transporter [Niallia sp. MER 6]MDL0434309.1 multidrug efflux SMR transporter [Niallia sp. SS-2023]UPO89057.1 multidrug efflux SMR transporter [Niallia sp. Man26]